MKKGFKVHKLASGVNDTTPPFDTREEAQRFLTTEIDVYNESTNLTLTTQTPDKLIWTNPVLPEDTLVIQIIDIEQQSENIKPELLEKAKRLEQFQKYIEKSIDANELALEFSLEFHDIQEIIDDCCYNLNQLIMYTKGEC